MMFFQQIARDASPKRTDRIRSITIRVCVTDCAGAVYITDLMLQGGSVATGWIGHVNEIKYTIDN